jgi:hypothetical protein
MTNPDYWDAKALCALRWIVMLNAMPLLSPEARRELST